MKRIIIVILVFMMCVINCYASEENDSDDKSILESINDMRNTVIDKAQEISEVVADIVLGQNVITDAVVSTQNNIVDGVQGLGNQMHNMIFGSGSKQELPTNPNYRDVDTGGKKYYFVVGTNTGQVLTMIGDNLRVGTFPHMTNYSKSVDGRVDGVETFSDTHGTQGVRNGVVVYSIDCKTYYSSDKDWFWYTNLPLGEKINNKSDYDYYSSHYSGYGTMGLPVFDDKGNVVKDDSNKILYDVPPVAPEDDVNNPVNPNYYDINDPFQRPTDKIDGIIPWLEYIAGLIKALPEKLNKNDDIGQDVTEEEVNISFDNVFGDITGSFLDDIQLQISDATANKVDENGNVTYSLFDFSFGLTSALFDRLGDVGQQDISLNIPEVLFMDYPIIPEQEINISLIMKETGLDVAHNIYLKIVNASMVIGLALYAGKRINGFLESRKDMI